MSSPMPSQCRPIRGQRARWISCASPVSAGRSRGGRCPAAAGTSRPPRGCPHVRPPARPDGDPAAADGAGRGSLQAARSGEHAEDVGGAGVQRVHQVQQLVDRDTTH